MENKCITVESLDEMLSASKDVILLDVRRKVDCEASPHKIPGAMWRDPENIDNWQNEMPAGQKIVVYCVKGGSVSQSVTNRLRSKGRDTLYLEGGIKAWADNGKKLKRYYIIQATDIDLLRKAEVSEDDIVHSLKVAEKALEIAYRTNKDLDFEFVGRGALFHDLGKAKTHEIEHGKFGAEMGKSLGLPECINAIMEKHIRGGLTAKEAMALNLPVKDYTLYTLEERIIIYADRLVDIITDGIVSINEEREAELRFEEILRTIPKYGKNENTLLRYLKYHHEIQSCM
jgi:uncharacterized protein